VPFQNFQTADGWVVVACAKEKFWRRLTGLLGRPELAGDPRFATFAARQDNAEHLLPVLEALFRTKTTVEWVSALRAAGIPSGPVNTVAQALADEQVAARGLIVDTEHPRWGTVRQPASPVRVGATPPSRRRAPRLNEHLGDISAELLGYDQMTLAELVADGAFGDQAADNAASHHHTHRRTK
jgi:crotonobetainyl-CoA:carnitine CoA-transferase CaiB-like acyl-CoA transferase